MNNIWSELQLHPWAVWLVAALISGILEVALPFFTFSFIGLAALAAALVAVFGGLGLQVAVFSVTLGVTMFILRPRLVARSQAGGHLMPSRTEALVGMTGRVSERIDPQTGQGRVQVDGQDWAARARVPLDTDCVVRVEGHDGIVLIVKEK